MYPQLACKIRLYPDRIILSKAGREVSFRIQGQTPEQARPEQARPKQAHPEQVGNMLPKLFALMDGTQSLDELHQRLCFSNALETHALEAIIQTLDEQGFLTDASLKEASLTSSPLMTVQDLSTFARALLSKDRQGSQLWSLLRPSLPASAIAGQMPEQVMAQTREQQTHVLHGFAVESYHLLASSFCFQPSGLTFQSSAACRQLVASLYHQASTQAERWFTALSALGLSHADIEETLPLPSTIGLCHGLAFWASFDALFYIVILGSLTERIYGDFERYLVACETFNLTPSFIEPIQQLFTPALKRAQTELLNHDFHEMAPLDAETSQRFIGQIYLLADMLDGFQTAIVNHYSTMPHLLRRVSAI
ncbi:MAG: hypothetical protein AAF152_15435 [Cyanobacteria bacterium P01_A01_bin.114]